MRALIVATALSAMALTGCMSTTGMSATGIDRKQMMLVSGEEVVQSSAASYAKVLQDARRNGTLDTNKAQVDRLRRIANNLVLQTTPYRPDAKSWKWEVHTIKSDQLNAYVMAGGKIMFYTGIIDKLKLTDDEIAAIMGHEISHALREHSRERMSRAYATQMTMGIAGGLLGLSQGEMDLAAWAGDLGLTKPHGRKQESEADQLGLELMARAGYNPQAAVSVWQKMQAIGGNTTPQFLSTHPSHSNRIATLQSHIPAVTPLYQQARR